MNVRALLGKSATKPIRKHKTHLAKSEFVRLGLIATAFSTNNSLLPQNIKQAASRMDPGGKSSAADTSYDEDYMGNLNISNELLPSKDEKE